MTVHFFLLSFCVGQGSCVVLTLYIQSAPSLEALFICLYLGEKTFEICPEDLRVRTLSNPTIPETATTSSIFDMTKTATWKSPRTHV